MLDLAQLYTFCVFIIKFLCYFVTQSSCSPLEMARCHFLTIDFEESIKKSRIIIDKSEVGSEILKLAEWGAICFKLKSVLHFGVLICDDPLQDKLLAVVIKSMGLLCNLLKSHTIPLLDKLAFNFQGSA